MRYVNNAYVNLRLRNNLNLARSEKKSEVGSFFSSLQHRAQSSLRRAQLIRITYFRITVYTDEWCGNFLILGRRMLRPVYIFGAGEGCRYLFS